MIAALKYFKENAAEFNIDDTKLILGGGSGGAYTVMVAAILLGRDNQSDLVKSMVLICPMLGRTLEDAPADQVPEWEKSFINCIPYSLLVDDFDKKHKNRDPLLYPFEISVEEAKKLP